MARRRKPPFGGDEKAERASKTAADKLVAQGDVYVSLDELRQWAITGRKLLDRAMAAIDPNGEVATVLTGGAMDDAPATGYIESVFGGALASLHVRGTSINVLELLPVLASAQTALNEIVRQLGAASTESGVDHADEVLRGELSREEVAIVTGLTVEAIEKRRNRRR